MKALCVLCLYVCLYSANGYGESNDLDSVCCTELPIEVFPNQYDLEIFKYRAYRHLKDRQCICESSGVVHSRRYHLRSDEKYNFNATDFFTNSTDDIDDSEEGIGPAVTQIYKHPYSASLLKNGTFVCSCVILNTYWVLTITKCFDSSAMSSYVSHKYLGNYTIRSGSNYNNKGGNIATIKMLISNFDLKISALKLTEPLVFNTQVQPVNLPRPDEEVSLGYLTSLLAWTPTGHIRVVNAPVIDPAICEASTRLLPGSYICIGGVQDPNRHFCRKDNGGAAIRNNTLIAITSFIHSCALYTRTHAFPKAASFARWLDTIIWDEDNRPTTVTESTPSSSTTEDRSPYFGDPRRFMLTLPFDPVNVPLQPAEDNSVLSRMSLYESYLHNLARMKTSTTANPQMEEKRKWLQKLGKIVKQYPKKYDFEYN